MNRITITLPLPPKELSPNARPHWAVKARAIKSYRLLAALICRGELLDDKTGKIAKIFPKVKVDGHAEEVLAALG